MLETVLCCQRMGGARSDGAGAGKTGGYAGEVSRVSGTLGQYSLGVKVRGLGLRRGW